ncbi:hypothetical protein L1987_74730 [Smallanthus sonchifolius]|uniref:Uncharacterized protein n=1 Tax=Smallanthus sonchifolius TaxID=185202 RepID=A0ACB9A543_9ASTR|nr:hypothetical protein L1987_74730 [Smallanthus sonchifolius]
MIASCLPSLLHACDTSSAGAAASSTLMLFAYMMPESASIYVNGCSSPTDGWLRNPVATEGQGFINIMRNFDFLTKHPSENLQNMKTIFPVVLSRCISIIAS